MRPKKEIGPQPGPQTQFMNSPADIIIYGGGAGGGKSYSLLLEPLRYIHNPGFTSTIFRKTYKQVLNQGSLWDTSEELYPYYKGVPKESALSWYFPFSKNSIKFAHLEHEKSKYNYQGSQICYEAFDELTHFTESQFFYMLSRNRSTCGIRPYVRATCNPDADSWVADLIAWWIDQDSGFPNQERAGVLRWFIRNQNNIYWDNSKAELWDQVKEIIPEEDFLPKSLTFIPAKLSDNPALTSKDPSYRGNLLALCYVDRERLLGGNWKIKPSAGNMFKLPWFKFKEWDQLPVNINFMKLVRWWDTAATEESDENKDPDWTAGVLMGEHEGKYFIFDLQHFRKSPGQTEAHILATAEMDGKRVTIGYEQEPGSAAKREAERLRSEVFRGYSFRAELAHKNKVIRAKPFSTAVENGLVYVIRNQSWNGILLHELTHFPSKGIHDDIVDCCTAAHAFLSGKLTAGDIDLEKIVRTRLSILGLD